MSWIAWTAMSKDFSFKNNFNAHHPSMIPLSDNLPLLLFPQHHVSQFPETFFELSLYLHLMYFHQHSLGCPIVFLISLLDQLPVDNVPSSFRSYRFLFWIRIRFLNETSSPFSLDIA